MATFRRQVQPDVSELVDVLLRRGSPRRLHVLELFLDEEIRQLLSARFGIEAGVDRSHPRYEAARDARLMAVLGYDAFRISVASKAATFDLPGPRAKDTTGVRGQSRGERQWQEEHRGPIQSMRDLERYPWPSVQSLDFSPFEWADRNLPEGMGCYDLTAHIFEMVSFLLGYEQLCYAVADDPQLVDALCERVGEFYVGYTRALADFRSVAVIWGRCAEIAHAKGKPYLLHSCGNLDAIMEDLIGEVRIDGRHSFEDAILPVVEAKRRYGDRIAIIGGIDMDFLCRAPEPAVRRRVRETLDACAPTGGYCLGTGNTVANYVPIDNYLAMLDEGRNWGPSGSDDRTADPGGGA
jgi:uroporphyrinogen decarboxylase